MIQLKSFDLKIRGSQAAGYTVEAVGPADETATAPFDPAPLATLAPDLEAIHHGEVQAGMLQRVGTALFQALFPEKIKMLYGAAARAQRDHDGGLRLRLHLPPELARWPWELLYDSPHFLALDPRSPVVRFLDLPEPPRPLATRPPLRLLHLVANPVDAPALDDVEREVAQLQAALAVLGNRVEIVPGRPGTLATLRAGLRAGCHVLHFSGHGGFSGEAGYLLFENEAGRGQPVDSDTLAHLLRGTSVRLAVLNACQTAVASGSDAFASVAAALVGAGLPAVVAHQTPIPEPSATAFSAEFYRALAASYPVDAAVVEGRKAVLSELGPTWGAKIDWATPVLLMQAPDGFILTLVEEEADGTTPATGPAAPTIHQQVTAGHDAATIGTIQDGTVHIDFGPSPAATAEKASAADPLPTLLDQLRQVVGQNAPRAKRAQALERVTLLKGAATDPRPDLDLLESVLHWFESELPILSGPVLSAILAFESHAAGDDDLLWDFQDRFTGS